MKSPDFGKNSDENRNTEADWHELVEQFDATSLGDGMYDLVSRLYPICRSITGNGVRETLRHCGELLPLKVHEVPSGTEVFDWTIPQEWNIRDAFIKNSAGMRIVDFQESNLHVISYSEPIAKKMTFAELRPHLHAMPEHPAWIPYRTSYYDRNWGFCVSQNTLDSMTDDVYEVVIDSSFTDGALTYADFEISGESDETVLLFAHTCHPSLCNDNLSGIAVLIFLAKYLQRTRTRLSYRFIFAPATIGSLTWLSRNLDILPIVKCGLVASVLGDTGHIHYKKTKSGSDEIDRIVQHALLSSGEAHDVLEFSPYGYDERQFASPGINLSVGRITRSPNGAFPEYHSSADNLNFVTSECLGQSLATYVRVISCLECNIRYLNLKPMGEPQLGRRGLYQKFGGFQQIADMQMAMLWLLNQSDGQNSLLDIAERSGIDLLMLDRVAEILCKHELLQKLPE